MTPKRVPILGEYADLGLQIDGRLEFRDEKNQSALCQQAFFFDPVANCRSAFEPLPQVDFQFAAKSGGIIADRIHVNLDYDTQREFDASNNISIYYEGKPSQFVQKLEVGNVTFQPPASRYITPESPSGNYGVQAVTKIGPMRVKTILAQQKGNIVRDRVFTVGDRTLQAIDRKIEDYQFEPRRFFFTIDPRLSRFRIPERGHSGYEKDDVAFGVAPGYAAAHQDISLSAADRGTATQSRGSAISSDWRPAFTSWAGIRVFA